MQLIFSSEAVSEWLHNQEKTKLALKTKTIKEIRENFLFLAAVQITHRDSRQRTRSGSRLRAEVSGRRTQISADEGARKTSVQEWLQT